MKDTLSLHATFSLLDRRLLLAYEVSNRNSIDAYLFNRIYRTHPRFEMSKDILYVELDAVTSTVRLSKKIPEVPEGGIDAPVFPYCMPLRAGGTFREEVHLPLPLQELTAYGQPDPRPAAAVATYRHVCFTLGYAWRSEGEIEEERVVQGIPVVVTRGGRPTREDYDTLTERVQLKVPVLA